MLIYYSRTLTGGTKKATREIGKMLTTTTTTRKRMPMANDGDSKSHCDTVISCVALRPFLRLRIYLNRTTG